MEVDLSATIIVGFISVVIGYVVGLLFSLWQNRLRPWVTLLECSGSSRAGDEVEVAQNMSKSLESVWVQNLNLPSGVVKMRDFGETYEKAKLVLDKLAKTEDPLESGVADLKSASNPNEVQQALFTLLKNNTVRSFLEVALATGEVTPPTFDDKIQPKIKVWFDDTENKGCFAIPHKTGVIFFGDDMARDQNLRAKIEPMMELICRIGKERLLTTFGDLLPLLRAQINILKVLAKDMRQIVEGNSRWMAEFSITNFGHTPFVLFPELPRLRIVGEHGKEFDLPCTLLVMEKKNTGKDHSYQPAKGVIVVKSETTKKLAVATEAQKNIKDGDILRAVYSNGDSEASLVLSAMGRAFPKKKKITSTKLKFREY